MKRLSIFLLTIMLAATPCILFVTCSTNSSRVNEKGEYLNSPNVSANATIIGADMRACICCGGYFVSINHQKPIAGEYFLTYDFPGGYRPASYPVNVYIEWEKDSNACINDKIIIKKIVPVSKS